MKSFDVTDTALVPKTELVLGGDVTDIHAEEDVLLVARGNPSWVSQSSMVSVVDISDTDGAMTLRDEVDVWGFVGSQFHMDIRGDVLRVFSGPRWGVGQQSYLQTYDASNKDDLQLLDVEPFGTDEVMFGAVFLDDRAFAVTYRRQDPFYAFSIAPDGQIEEKSELNVSGWNDFLRPAFDASRLVGIGVDDSADSHKMAVSLYDITDLENPDPLVAREQVEGQNGGWDWSEANWDHRAFTVADHAVNVEAPTGEAETGLVLLPFAGWQFVNDHYEYRAAVQMFTFSDTTVTRRGIMEHSEPVRRAFRIPGDKGVNISNHEVRVYDQSDVDAPVEQSRLDVAPSYWHVYEFGDYLVRIKEPDWYYWWSSDHDDSVVEVVPKGQSLDTAEPVAEFHAPFDAIFEKVGDRLAVVTSRPKGWPTYETTITSYDLSDPTAPQQAGTLTTTALPPAYDSYWGQRVIPGLQPVGDAALVFLSSSQEVTSPSDIDSCVDYVPEGANCYGSEGCQYFAGQRECRSIDGQPPYCFGGFASCIDHVAVGPTCTPLEWADVQPMTISHCSHDHVELSRLGFTFTAVSLTDPAGPKLSAPISLPATDSGVSTLVDGNRLFVTVKEKTQLAFDPRPYVRYYIRELDLSSPQSPVLGDRISVPGELIDKRGQTLVTHDKVWGARFMKSAITALELGPDGAEIVNRHQIQDRSVNRIVMDGDNAVLLDSSLWRPHALSAYYEDKWDQEIRLSILGPQAAPMPGYDVLSETPLPTWINIGNVEQHRAFIEVSGSSLMVNLDNPEKPLAQAFFLGAYYSYSYGTKPLIADGQVYVPGGPYGIHQIGVDETNVLPP